MYVCLRCYTFILHLLHAAPQIKIRENKRDI